MAGNPLITEISKGTRFSSSYQPKNAGRKPSKLKKFIKDNNVSSLDIRLIAKKLLEADRQKLQELAADPTQPIMLSGAAAAMLKDMAKGQTNTQQWLYERAWGKAVQPVDFNDMAQTNMTIEERQIRIEELLKKRGNNDDVQ